ncbi:MAG: hypothetical protein ACR2RB_14395 [Gammaproteobacteria bacterium]
MDKAWKSPPHPGAIAGREILGLFVQDFTGKVLKSVAYLFNAMVTPANYLRGDEFMGRSPIGAVCEHVGLATQAIC